MGLSYSVMYIGFWCLIPHNYEFLCGLGHFPQSLQQSWVFLVAKQIVLKLKRLLGSSLIWAPPESWLWGFTVCCPLHQAR